MCEPTSLFSYFTLCKTEAKAGVVFGELRCRVCWRLNGESMIDYRQEHQLDSGDVSFEYIVSIQTPQLHYDW
jgi:hypothetical protein